MGSYSLLIYGAGNCEIAGALDQELKKITLIDKPNLKIFARGHIFDASCVEMYRRFEDIKENLKQSSHGGIHEYFYNGKETVTTYELKMKAASESSFERFLAIGSEKFDQEEVILILIGQGNLTGMFLDFSQIPPSYISYDKVFELVSKYFKGKVKRLSIMMDISKWHNVYMPLVISKHNFIDTTFVYERPEYLSIFPISTWINKVFDESSHWSELTYTYFNGYRIDSHPIWWNSCKEKWEEYVKFPSGKTWSDFYHIYEKILIYNGAPQALYNNIDKSRVDYKGQITLKDLQNYFNNEYLTEINEEEVEKWLNELKICTDYYKL